MQTLSTEIEDIVMTIWSTLIDLPITGGGGGLRPDETTMTSIVNIEGAWHGAVLVQCPMSLAGVLASAMFQGESLPTTDEIGDALGELTNVVAGNIKALLPEACAISLPTIARGSNYEISVVGTRPVVTLHFTCSDDPIVVALVQRAGDVEVFR